MKDTIPENVHLSGYIKEYEETSKQEISQKKTQRDKSLKIRNNLKDTESSQNKNQIYIHLVFLKGKNRTDIRDIIFKGEMGNNSPEFMKEMNCHISE